jgi:hypothetical protein
MDMDHVNWDLDYEDDVDSELDDELDLLPEVELERQLDTDSIHALGLDPAALN